MARLGVKQQSMAGQNKARYFTQLSSAITKRRKKEQLCRQHMIRRSVLIAMFVAQCLRLSFVLVFLSLVFRWNLCTQLKPERIEQ